MEAIGSPSRLIRHAVAAINLNELNFQILRPRIPIGDGIVMDSIRVEGADERSVPARGLWPWAAFTVALAAGLALFFIYPPR
jgi:hypothetical protein